MSKRNTPPQIKSHILTTFFVTKKSQLVKLRVLFLFPSIIIITKILPLRMS